MLVALREACVCTAGVLKQKTCERARMARVPARIVTSELTHDEDHIGQFVNLTISTNVDILAKIQFKLSQFYQNLNNNVYLHQDFIISQTSR